ncbi:hypothetical protein ACLOJK_041341 [Asimina triloba]
MRRWRVNNGWSLLAQVALGSKNQNERAADRKMNSRTKVEVSTWADRTVEFTVHDNPHHLQAHPNTQTVNRAVCLFERLSKLGHRTRDWSCCLSLLINDSFMYLKNLELVFADWPTLPNWMQTETTPSQFLVERTAETLQLRHFQRKQAVCRNAGQKTRRRFPRNSSVESLLSPSHFSISRGFGGAVLRIISSKKSLQMAVFFGGSQWVAGLFEIAGKPSSFYFLVLLSEPFYYLYNTHLFELHMFVVKAERDECIMVADLADWVGRLFAPVMALSSAELARNGEPKVLSYAHAVAKPADNPSFVMPMRFPVDINGELGFIFSEPEMAKAAEDYKFAIMKNERDFVHGWAREGRTMEGISFRLFKWTKDFDFHTESPLTPQWIFLPGLPLHLFRPDCLQIFATRFGRYLGTDNATLNRTRATGARICVEGHTAVVCRIGERLVFEGKPKEKSKTWQPKNMKTRREASGTKVGLETEKNTVLPNAILSIIPEESNFQQNNVVIEGTSDEDLFTRVAMIETESIQGLKNCADNQLEDSDKECEEVCCDEDLEVVPETAQTWTYVEKSPLSSRSPVLGKQIGELASGSYSDQEEGEITELKGKGRAYDSDGDVHSEFEKKINEDVIVRRSKRVPTRSQKLNL